MSKLIHSMIRVSDLDRSISFYQSALELEVTHYKDQQEPYTH